MGTDHLDFEINGTRLRVNFEGVEIGQLREELAEFVVDEAGDLAFVVRAPEQGKKFYLVLDRAGFVLARLRSERQALEVLIEHLGVFLPGRTGTVRLRARALVREGLVVLAPFPIFVDPPIVERRLERLGFRIVDRLAVDVRVDGAMAMTTADWTTGHSNVVGHTTAPSGELEVAKLLVPAMSSAPGSAAGTIAMLVTASDHQVALETRVDLAELLSARTQPVVLDNRQSRYDALAAMGSGEVR